MNRPAGATLAGQGPSGQSWGLGKDLESIWTGGQGLAPGSAPSPSGPRC